MELLNTTFKFFLSLYNSEYNGVCGIATFITSLMYIINNHFKKTKQPYQIFKRLFLRDFPLITDCHVPGRAICLVTLSAGTLLIRIPKTV